MKCSTNGANGMNVKFYGSATVGTKGQVVIPAEAREALKISEGEKLLVMGLPSGNGVALLKADSLDEMMQGMQRHMSQMQQIVEEHRKTD